MKMGTCEQPKQPEHEEQVQGDGLNMEENNVTITGPPASRTVIDNLKKLLLQRQHSRESDTENNRNIAIRSDQGSNSDAAFYSQFSTSSSDSDSSDYMIFQEISNQDGCTNGEGRRKHRRRRSYSSSSSSSSSPVARCRRKVTRVNVTLASSIADVGGGGEASAPQKSSLDEQVRSNEYNDSANSTSSHKDSSSEDNFPGGANQNSKSLSSSEEPVAPNRCAKLKSRRDRDRKRKRYGKNYTSHRSKLLKVAEKTTITSSPTDGSSQLQADAADENKTQVSLTCAATTTSAPSNVESVSIPVTPSEEPTENKESNEQMESSSSSSTAPNVSVSFSSTENPVSHDATDK